MPEEPKIDYKVLDEAVKKVLSCIANPPSTPLCGPCLPPADE